MKAIELTDQTNHRGMGLSDDRSLFVDNINVYSPLARLSFSLANVLPVTVSLDYVYYYRQTDTAKRHLAYVHVFEKGVNKLPIKSPTPSPG